MLVRGYSIERVLFIGSSRIFFNVGFGSCLSFEKVREGVGRLWVGVWVFIVVLVLNILGVI